MTPEKASPLMDAQDTHVFYVQAQSRQLRGVYPPHSDDLRPQWGCFGGGYGGGPGVVVEEFDYFRSKIDRVHHETKRFIPAGSYYKLVDVEKSNYVATNESIQYFNDLATGKRVVMETLDPCDPDKRLTFKFWSHDEPSRESFEPTHRDEMTIIAIAATGL